MASLDLLSWWEWLYRGADRIGNRETRWVVGEWVWAGFECWSWARLDAYIEWAGRPGVAPLPIREMECGVFCAHKHWARLDA